MNDSIKGVSDAVADGDLPLSARIALAREGIAAIELRLKQIAAEQADLADRLQRGESVDADIEREAQELKRLRGQTERKYLMMTGYVARLERERA